MSGYVAVIVICSPSLHGVFLSSSVFSSEAVQLTEESPGSHEFHYLKLFSVSRTSDETSFLSVQGSVY